MLSLDRRISHSYVQPNLILWVAPLAFAAKVNADDEGIVDGLSAERVLREGVAEP